MIKRDGRDDFDLDDNDDDLQQCPRLKGLLVVLKELLWPVYDVANRAAIEQQRRHSRLVWWAAICGTVAVLCAILELSEMLPLDHHLVGWVEVVAAVVALVLVVRGLWFALHPRWLLKRFIAEQCRFVKFHLLLNPADWHGRTPDELRATVKRMLTPLDKPGRQFVHDWVSWKQPIVGRYDAIPANLPVDVIREVLDYCQAKRLEEQQSYFARQAGKRYRLERLTRHVSPAAFFLSILAAFVHFLFALLAGHEPHNGLHTAAHISTLLAATLPVLAAGMRTIRAAHEYGRNQLRFAAMSNYLKIIQIDLTNRPPTATPILLLREAESALDAEHRAWLRLMIEAEWFG